MKKLFLSLMLLGLSASPVVAQETMPVELINNIPPMPESHSYTYVVQDDGSAQVWLRVDGLAPQSQESTYKFTLPDGTTGTPTAWYRENGCLQYRNDICSYYGSTTWKEAVSSVSGQDVTITIPKATIIARNPNENNVNVGITFQVSSVTDQKWWGRVVNIATAKSDQFVSYLNVGVYVPEGVFTRDRSQGPAGWAASISNTIAANQSKPEGFGGGDSRAYTSMLDMTGSGQIYRNRSGLTPGQDYKFSFMTATSMWKLFYPEISIAIGWLLAIAIIIALLLRLIIGRRPLQWYLAVTGLLVLLGILFGGLWFTFQTSRSPDFGYPMPLFKGAGGMRDGAGGGAAPAVETAPDVTEVVESEPAEIMLETPAE